jgi:large subunit ribosomal protein L17
MRHAVRSQRLSLPSDRREATLHNLVRNLVTHGQIRTTLARAKETQRLADRLVTMGKGGSVHSRRRAFRILQDRDLVKQLFAEIAPRYLDVAGGYTRVTRLGLRRGDGANIALLSLTRLPAPVAAPAPSAKPEKSPDAPAAKPKKAEPETAETGEKPKNFFEGLRGIWGRKKKGGAA